LHYRGMELVRTINLLRVGVKKIGEQGKREALPTAVNHVVKCVAYRMFSNSKKSVGSRAGAGILLNSVKLYELSSL